MNLLLCLVIAVEITIILHSQSSPIELYIYDISKKVVGFWMKWVE